MVSYLPKFPADYRDPQGYENGDQVSAVADMEMAGAVLWEVAHARRNILALPLNCSGVLALSGPGKETLFRIPMPIASYLHEVKVAIRYKTSTVVAGNEVYFLSGEELTLSATYAWQVFTIAAFDVGKVFEVAFHSVDGGSNTVTVACVCAYQEEYDAFPAWTDLSGATCKVGVDDFPYSAHMLKRLTDNVQHVRWRSMPRKVICCHWFRAYQKNGASYGSDEDDLGHYYFVKPAGVSTIYVDLCFDCDASTKHTVLTMVSDSVETSTESLLLEPDASGDALWFSHTYTFAGADITDELICSLKIDSKITSGSGYCYIPGVCVRPAFIAAAPSSAPFSMQDFATGRDIDSDHMAYVSAALHYLRDRICLCQLLADWRWNGTVEDDYGDMTPTEAAYDKGDHGATASTIARAIMFAGRGAWRIVAACGFKINDTATDDLVTLQYLLSDSMTEATNDDEGPLSTGEWSENGEDYAQHQSPGVIRDMKAVLDVAAAADWEDPAAALTRAGAVPHQIWIQSITEAATAYLIPHYVVIYEDLMVPGDPSPW